MGLASLTTAPATELMYVCKLQKWLLSLVVGTGYEHHSIDIRDRSAIEELYTRFGSSIDLVIHAASDVV